LLLADKPHPDAQKLLAFHHANPDFLPRIVAEFRLLKRLGRKAGGIKALIHFLRWDRRWAGVDEFEIAQNIGTLAIRVCALLWPDDINGIVQFRESEADEILGTRIVRRGKRYGNFLRPLENAGTVPCSTLPSVPALDRPPTFHNRISEAEAVSVAGQLREIVDNSPNPRHTILRAWLRHIEAQPEIYAFMERTLLQRQPDCFSARSILEYSRWSIRRAAESHKRFTLPGQFDGLYCRALVMRNPQFNGLCRFEGSGRVRSNGLLGCTLAPEPINDEPFRRLLWSGSK
jgi:hypothetical protein